MASTGFRPKVEKILSAAGISVGGNRPWDITVHNDDFYSRVMAKGSLGLGESYMDGWWDCESLDEFFHRLLRADIDSQVRTWTDISDHIKSRLVNLQKGARAYQIGRRHYDIGNNLYKNMLDGTLSYSCGYWSGASSLEAAQEAKLELICRKLKLKPGMRVLDIGCGWGGAARYAAEKYGVEVVGITVSEEQKKLALDMCSGLPVDIRLMDYRDMSEKFDRIFSIGMFEHVGSKNYNDYFGVVQRCLDADGLFLLHTIGRNSTTNSTGSDPWIVRYIFPNSMLPSAREICRTSESRFVIEDWHNFGPDYDTTLMQWYRNFTDRWDRIKEDYDGRFYRMWTYYLLCCAGAFRARRTQVWQVVMSEKGLEGGYEPVR